MKLKSLGIMILVAVCLGLLEAAWTAPGHGGPRDPTLGCIAIGVVLVVVCWRRWWWIPGLSMLEETIQVLVGTLGAWRPTSSWVFHHWSAAHFGINLYPVIVFPLMTVIGEAVYLWVLHKRARAAGAKPDEPADMNAAQGLAD